ARRDGARAERGTRPRGAVGNVEHGGERSGTTSRDGGGGRPAAHAAARHLARGAGARNDHPRGDSGVSALPIFGEQGAGSGTLRRGPEVRLGTEGTAPRSPLPQVRPAALTDVPALESLMAPYVATGDLLPRSNYDLCRHIKEYLVAE